MRRVSRKVGTRLLLCYFSFALLCKKIRRLVREREIGNERLAQSHLVVIFCFNTFLRSKEV
jgi:hypothetical protein